MANPTTSLPLYERVTRKNTIARVIELSILSLLLSLLAYRILSFQDHGFSWLLASLCESWFAFNWVLTVSTKWNQVEYKTHPQRLLQRKPELPPVDMFVTTADPVLEPPILTVNTVLSLLALDYPADKLACYVSDDGSSPLTFYSLVEASKFAKLWVPFCKKYSIQVRAPFRYFSGESMSSQDTSPQFQQDWKKMKDEYEQLSQKIEDAARGSIPCELAGEFADFMNMQRGNHASIVKVIWENKEAGNANGAVPHLVYISREKRPKHPHHFKAGAMNVLTRVSGVMTNAPFVLNVDCDMYVNNPQIVLHALCLLLGVKSDKDCAFVQFPQQFYDGLKDDPYGNQYVVLYEYLVRGLAGIQGPFYGGTGCFHRRKVIYGLSPYEYDEEISGKLSDENLHKTFGSSMEFTKSAAQILSGSKSISCGPHDLLSSVEAANQVAACVYEYSTAWGREMGWIYGSTTEDVLTGLIIQGRGWKSTTCMPTPPGFLGCAPSGGPATMTQQKRWATGLVEILVTRRSPLILTLVGELQFRQCLAYLWILLWGLRSVPELCYATLPAYCIISGSRFLPKVEEPALLIPVVIFITYNLYTLSEYFRAGLSARAWWNNQRMLRITAMTAWLFGVFSVILKLLGLSEMVFEVTQKEQSSTNGSDDDNADVGRFTFDESPIFIPATTVLLVNLTALVITILGFRPVARGGNGSGIGEVIFSSCVVLCLWAFLKGLFGKGKYGIPSATVYKSGALALLFVNSSRWTSMG
ncbi:cellulose synthase-like protein H1 isoform X1 [Rhododendron vialii]|uniref:cellulose synthase-like protein H1 isoform X1 n=1 Tax=Rhododendron vialii TaxID=182163 RepID=UPI00265F2CF1|nr:cellulose synthase-like protein H1 isoform X1 [Rhododendron vialii]